MDNFVQKEIYAVSFPDLKPRKKTKQNTETQETQGSVKLKKEDEKEQNEFSMAYSTHFILVTTKDSL